MNVKLLGITLGASTAIILITLVSLSGSMHYIRAMNPAEIYAAPHEITPGDSIIPQMNSPFVNSTTSETTANISENRSYSSADTTSIKPVIETTTTVSANLVVVPSNSTIAAVGDWGCLSSTASTVKVIKSFNPDRVLALGDLSYRDSTYCWDQLISPIFDKTRIVIGNHDLQSAMLANYMKNFGLSKQYYSFDYNNVHFLIMSSEISYKKDSAQYNFVTTDLASAAGKSNIDWIIVAVHKPMYTSSSNQPAPTDLRATYHPIFDKYGVDLVLMGHNHNYQRTYPLMFNSATPSKPLIKSYSKTCYDDPSGEIYLIAGTGGQSHSYLGSQKAFVIKQFSDRYGIAKIEITNVEGQNGLISTMSVAFHANGKPTTQVDPFKIIKDPTQKHC